jgi:hypothetical protein
MQAGGKGRDLRGFAPENPEGLEGGSSNQKQRTARRWGVVLAELDGRAMSPRTARQVKILRVTAILAAVVGLGAGIALLVEFGVLVGLLYLVFALPVLVMVVTLVVDRALRRSRGREVSET